MTDFSQALSTLIQGNSISRGEAQDLMGLWMSENVDETQLSAILAALETRGHDADELTGFAQGLRDAAKTVELHTENAVDTCGTGGDGLHTFNFSTAAALVAAGAGVTVAKHGNRAVSSKVGSADVLEALGVQIDGKEERVKRSVKETGFGFFFAPLFHPAMRFVAPTRKKLGVRTVFNLLGPLANPAKVKRQVVGISCPELAPTYARVLSNLGVERAMVVYGQDGMDELSLTSNSFISHVLPNGQIKQESISPEDVGLNRVSLSDLAGSDAETNAKAMEETISGADGPLLDGTLLNAAAAIVVAGKAPDLKQGVQIARRSVTSGRAREVLTKLRNFSNNKGLDSK